MTNCLRPTVCHNVGKSEQNVRLMASQWQHSYSNPVIESQLKILKVRKQFKIDHKYCHYEPKYLNMMMYDQYKLAIYEYVIKLNEIEIMDIDMDNLFCLGIMQMPLRRPCIIIHQGAVETPSPTANVYLEFFVKL